MLEVAEICRRHGAAYCAQQRLRPSQQRALRDIQACRTAYFGGHLKQCDHCGGKSMPIIPVATPTVPSVMGTRLSAG